MIRTRPNRVLDEEEYEGGESEGQQEEADSQKAMLPEDGLDELIEHNPSLANLPRVREVRLEEHKEEQKEEEKEVKESVETERTVDNEFDLKVLKNKTASTKQEDKMDVEKKNVRLDGIVNGLGF